MGTIEGEAKKLARLRAFPPLICPQIKDVVEVYIGQQRRNDRTVRRAFFRSRYHPVFHEPSLEPFADQANYT